MLLCHKVECIVFFYPSVVTVSNRSRQEKRVLGSDLKTATERLIAHLIVESMLCRPHAPVAQKRGRRSNRSSPCGTHLFVPLLNLTYE